MFDATGKFPTGILRGNIQWLGNYKECINTSLIPGLNDTRHRIDGHYCPVAFGMPAKVHISLWIIFGLAVIYLVRYFG